jgi:ATP-dependent DNA helicase RecQ
MEKAKLALKSYFGYDEFRPQQAEIISTILEGRDTIVLMPTGGGKSLCFQIPAIIMDGTCVVVSPLIALMKDQVEGLKANGVKAAYINSSASGSENQEVESQAMRGELDLLYVSPEKMLSSEFFNLLSTMKVCLIAIDEAHCISQWGHDFRPEYQQMGVLKQRFPTIPMVALTATADKLTRKDIEQHLKLQDATTFLASFDRPNLSLTVVPAQDRVNEILSWVKARPGQSGIVYCLSRKSVEEVAGKLKLKGIKAGFYHAGMNAGDRARVQEDFVKDDLEIIVATIAFGMGIDKSNVRWVIHYNLPKNIESYYQEIGRGGRDGLPSETLLYYSYADVIMLQKFIDDSGQKEILQTKLDRMVQYADAKSCRRQILLSYFGEHYEGQCDNCDNCKNPQRMIDGTVLVQKALSACLRTEERVGGHMIADILRGSNNQEIKSKNYHLLKTYGAGQDVPRKDWMEYIVQMLNMGIFEMAYDEGNALKVTSIGKEVLFNGRQVMLARPRDFQKEAIAKKAAAAPKPQPSFVDALFEELRKLRKQIADEQGVPPYVIFHDRTLKLMAEEHPTSELAMRQVSGVGDRKYMLYGADFMDCILRFLQDRQAKRS